MTRASTIQNYCNIIRNVFLKEGGGRYAVALYLIGGAPRSELTCAVVRGRLKIYNDLDILVIVKKKSIQCLLKMRRIQQAVNDGRFGFQVDLVIESFEELVDPEPTIQNYDIQNYKQWLWGEDIYACSRHRPRILDPSKIYVADGLKLLFNRLGSLLIGLKELNKSSPKPEYVQVQLSKPLFAMMISLLISEGLYNGRVTEQFKIVCRQKTMEHSHSLWEILDDDMMALLQMAVVFKKTPEPGHFRPFQVYADFIGKYYYLFLLRFLAWAYDAPDATEEDAILLAFRQHQPVQVDIVSSSWWVAVARYVQTGKSKVRFPSQSVHPLVDVYCEMVRWLGSYVSKTGDADCSDSVHGITQKSIEELSALIEKWRNSAYGCKLS
ncbi:MAG: nucleotidyltransferase domain-containing protein [Thermodesulfobacteriota bacterium]|nr:nucleotidyltransferase domain-containing protein [Thermodesulfobacteriota bacterium]